jgi:hypothetical protein
MRYWLITKLFTTKEKSQYCYIVPNFGLGCSNSNTAPKHSQHLFLSLFSMDNEGLQEVDKVANMLMEISSTSRLVRINLTLLA